MKSTRFRRRIVSLGLLVAALGDRVPADEGLCPPWPVGPQTVLVDGGVIPGMLERVDDSHVVARTLAFGTVRLPRAMVVGWRSELSADRDAALDTIARDTLRGPSAILRFDNGDTLVATTLGVTSGTATVTIAGAASPLSFPIDRVRSIDFSTASDPVPGSIVATVDGSRIPTVARSTEAGLTRLSLAPTGTPSIPCDPAIIVAEAERGRISRPLETFPLTVREGLSGRASPTSIVGSRSLSGGPLRARGDNAFTGFAIEAPAVLRFRIDPPADRFTARFAIDDGAGQGASIRATIRAGNSEDALSTIHETGVVMADEASKPIDLWHPGMRVLEIEITAGADGPGVPTVWLDPIVRRTSPQ